MTSGLLTSHSHRRLNSLTGEWVLVSPQRTLRPWQGIELSGELVRTSNAISSSRILGWPASADDVSMDVSNTAPRPSVLVIVGACMRVKKSGNRSSPSEPTTVVRPPRTSSAVPGSVTQSGNAGVLMAR